MPEVRRRLDLEQEPLGAERLGQRGLQHLQRDFTLVTKVGCQIDGGHPALAELALYVIAPCES